MIKSYYYEAPKAADYAEAIERGNAYARRAAEARAVALEVLPIFNGKKCGEKTRAKIGEAAKARGWSLHLTDAGRAVLMHKLDAQGWNDHGGTVEFCGGFLNAENILNAEAIKTAAACCGEGYSANISADKVLNADEVSRTAEELSAAAVAVFEALKKAAEAVKAYNAIAEHAPNVSTLYGGELCADSYARIKII